MSLKGTSFLCALLWEGEDVDNQVEKNWRDRWKKSRLHDLLSGGKGKEEGEAKRSAGRAKILTVHGFTP